MSRYEIQTVTCPECKHSFEFKIWNSINTMLNPEMKETVRNGEAFIYTCPKCGCRVRVVYPCLYHQMEDEIMIWLDPGDDIEKTEALLEGRTDNFQEFLPGNAMESYQNRLVFSVEELREKLFILDAGFDDRIIELMKVHIRTKLMENLPETDLDQMYFMTTENGQHLFCVFLQDEQIGNILFDEGYYEGLSNVYTNYISDNNKVIVNTGWAIDLIKQIEEDEL